MHSIIARTAIIAPTVELGDNGTVQDYVVLGADPATPSDEPLRIGAGAIIRSHAVIYHGSRIGDRFQAGHGAMIREANDIGSDVSIGSHSIVEHHVVIGDGVRIHSSAFIPEFSVIEPGAWIGPHVTFTNARYPQSKFAKSTLAGPVVRTGARIGAGATLLPGVEIGRNALVGAGAVVAGDVGENTVVVGNPAKVVRLVTEIEEYDPPHET